MTTTPDLSADIIDSRDIVQAYEDLRSDAILTLEEQHSMASDDFDADEVLDEMLKSEDLGLIAEAVDTDELLAFHTLNGEGEDEFGSEWNHGITLIADSYFEEYAEQLAEDIGAIDSEASWPLNRIDWAAAAKDLQQDYVTITIDGTEYWGRA